MVHLFKPTSYRTGTVLAVGATSVWKFLSFINALLVAAYFGVTTETDIYFYLIMLMGTTGSLVHSLNITAIIPEAMFLEETKPGQGKLVLNFFFKFYAVIIVFILLLGVCSPTYALASCSRFTLEQLTAHTLLIRLSFLLFGLQLFAFYLTAILEMYHRFTTSLLTPLNALFPLVFLLALGHQIGILSMMLGFVCSYAIQVVLLVYSLKKELHWNFACGGYTLSSRLKHNLGSIGVQSVLNIICGWLPIYLLSGMGMGLVSALNYAKQLSETPTEILTSRVANLSKLQLTEHVSRQDWQQGNINYLAVNHFLFFLLAPLAVFSCFYAQEIVLMFFQRGAFTVQDGVLAANFLRPLLFVMLFIAPGSLQANILSATRMWKEFFTYSLIGYFLMLILLPITMHYWGGLAYPYTLLFCNLLGLSIAYFFLKRFVSAWQATATWRQMGRIFSLNIIALVPSAIYGWYFAGSNPWITVLIGGIIFVATLGGLSYYSGDLQFFIRQCLPKSKI